METDDTWHMKFDADGKFLINEESEVFEEMLAFSKAMADEVAKNKFELCVDNIADLHARGLHPSRMMAAFRAFTNPSGGIGDAARRRPRRLHAPSRRVRHRVGERRRALHR